MKIIPLTAAEAANGGFTHRLELTYADVILLTSGTAASVYPGFNGSSTFPAGTYVRDAALRVVTAFAGDSGTLTLSLGDGNSATSYLAATTLKTAGYTAAFNSTKPAIYSAADTLDITVTSQNAITSWTAGEAHIYLALTDLSKLER